jgi:hypothetical protein
MKKLLLYLLLFTYFNLTAQTNNYSLEFNDLNTRVEIPTINLGNDFTIMLSAKENDLIDFGELVSIGGNLTVVFANDTTFRFNIGNSGNYSSWHFPGGASEFYSSSLNTWNHFAINYNSDTLSVFFNGLNVFIGYAPGYSISGISWIGDMNFSSSYSYNYGGKIDDLSYWAPHLSNSEIQQFMNCPPTGNEADLFGYWNFEEGTGTIANDLSANSNSGTLLNSPTWSTDVPPYNCCTENPITSQPTDQTVNMGNDATFTFTDSLTAATYQWQLDAGTGYTNLSNAGQFSGSDTKTLNISAVTISNNNTNYRCLVTESSSCMDTTDVANLTVSSGNSINEYDNATVKIYPNPTNGWVTLSLTNTTKGQVILTDVLGKEVLSKSFTSNEVQLNLKGLESKGTYFAKVLGSAGNVIAIKKLIYQ